MTQTKITSIFGNKASKPEATVSHMKVQNCQSNVYQECIHIDNEKTSNNILSGNKDDPISIQAEALEKSHGIPLKSKRRHLEFTSPICENAKSPSSNKETNLDTSSHGFMTARTKLVIFLTVTWFFYYCNLKINCAYALSF